MAAEIGRYVKQPNGFKAFTPSKFPPTVRIELIGKTERLYSAALRSLGKLDGITHLLPDIDFFILMYVRKEAAHSSQIEGTKATMLDSLRAEVEPVSGADSDVDDIVHYVKAMNYGLKRLEEFPLSLRFIREVHGILMKDGRADNNATPGEFRTSQNWIGGHALSTAHYVPPAIPDMNRSLGDLENFLSKENDFPPLIKMALAHAQFETIHPFNDGNGRTGRLLTTFYLCREKILERPVLYLSEYLKKHRKAYFDLLDRYHDDGDIVSWLNFFLEGVDTVATQAIETCGKVTALRERDIARMQNLGRSAERGTLVLKELFRQPVATAKTIEKWTGLTRVNANVLLKKFVTLGILEQVNKKETYARSFIYRDYVKIFT